MERPARGPRAAAPRARARRAGAGGEDEEIRIRLDALADLDSPETAEYLGLLHETLLADRAEPGITEKLYRLLAADAVLRASLGARPAWERELEERAAQGAAPPQG